MGAALRRRSCLSPLVAVGCWRFGFMVAVAGATIWFKAVAG